MIFDIVREDDYQLNRLFLYGMQNLCIKFTSTATSPYNNVLGKPIINTYQAYRKAYSVTKDGILISVMQNSLIRAETLTGTLRVLNLRFPKSYKKNTILQTLKMIFNDFVNRNKPMNFLFDSVLNISK